MFPRVSQAFRWSLRGHPGKAQKKACKILEKKDRWVQGTWFVLPCNGLRGRSARTVRAYWQHLRSFHGKAHHHCCGCIILHFITDVPHRFVAAHDSSMFRLEGRKMFMRLGLYFIPTTFMFWVSFSSTLRMPQQNNTKMDFPSGLCNQNAR